MTTASTTLLKYANQLFTRDEFQGVFARDTLPNAAGILSDTSFIVNTDTHNLPGTHWVAIISRDNEAYYFDPLGYTPPLMIINWLNEQFDAWNCNQRQIQPILSNFCGYFCLHFLYVAHQPHMKDIELHRIIDHMYPKSKTYNQYQGDVNSFMLSHLK